MKITSSKQVYDCGLFRVTEDVAVDPKTGFQIKRSVVRHIGSAVMMAVDEKKRVLLVRQYRLPAEKYLWELPAGTARPRRKATAGRQTRAQGRDRLRGAKVDEAGVLLGQPRLRAGAHDHLPRRRSHRGRGHSDGRRTDRGPLVQTQGTRRA